MFKGTKLLRFGLKYASGKIFQGARRNKQDNDKIEK